jgi:hypothetical protein
MCRINVCIAEDLQISLLFHRRTSDSYCVDLSKKILFAHKFYVTDKK